METFGAIISQYIANIEPLKQKEQLPWIAFQIILLFIKKCKIDKSIPVNEYTKR
jgi:hypothetical protein